MREIEQEILQYNYWEHFKAAKELSRILGMEHPRRKEIEKTMNELLLKINSTTN